jgi:hypothetical protein
MSWLALIKSFFGALVHAVGQIFEWLNRREKRQEQEEDNERVTEIMSAAAKPTQENADRLNRWLSRGRSGRLRKSEPPESR